MTDTWSTLQSADAALADARLAGAPEDVPGMAALAAEDQLVREHGGVTPDLERRAVRWALRVAKQTLESIGGGLLGLQGTGPDADLVELLDLAVARVQRWSPRRDGVRDLEGAVARIRAARASSTGTGRLLRNAFLLLVRLFVGYRLARLLPSTGSTAPARDRRETPVLAVIDALQRIAREVDVAGRPR